MASNRRRLWIAGAGLAAVYVGAQLLMASVCDFAKVPAHSMVPTLMAGDHIVVQRLGYGPDDVRRGDLVMFEAPFLGGASFVKRVVGVPGDVVVISPGRVRVGRSDDASLDLLRRQRLESSCEEVTSERCTVYEESLGAHRYRVQFVGAPAQDAGPERRFEVPAGHVFVLGDNRNESHDSSQWSETGPDGVETPRPYLSMEFIEGKVTRIYLPLDRMGPLG